jgi:CheY-like chemotaxis protein
MDGYELARRLREADHDVKLVAITGYGHATALTKSQAAGFQAHLVKPITLQQVQATIDQLTR